jgi:hypothetical protein
MGNCFRRCYKGVHEIGEYKVMDFSYMFKKHGRDFIVDYDVQALYINLGEFHLYPEIRLKGFPTTFSGLHHYFGNVKLFYFRTIEIKDTFYLT